MTTVDDDAVQVCGAAVDYQGIITIEPGKRGGKPVIRGLRITVDDVLSYLAAGMTVDQIVADFPPIAADECPRGACSSRAQHRHRSSDHAQAS